MGIQAKGWLYPFFLAQLGHGNRPSQPLQNDPDLVLSGESSARVPLQICSTKSAAMVALLPVRP